MWTTSDVLASSVLLVACNLLLLQCALSALSRSGPPHAGSSGSRRSRS